jgi:hypothetical protein
MKAAWGVTWGGSGRPSRPAFDDDGESYVDTRQERNNRHTRRSRTRSDEHEDEDDEENKDEDNKSVKTATTVW